VPIRVAADGWQDTDFLHKQNGAIALKETRKYYTQVQSQMASTGCRYCLFYVWSPIGSHLEKIFLSQILDFPTTEIGPVFQLICSTIPFGTEESSNVSPV
jgi:hypothetical protein